MAKITPRKNKDGKVTSYTIRVSNGYDASGKQILTNMAWTPDHKMTEKQIEKELQKQAVMFEEKVKIGTYFDENITFKEYSEKWLENRKSNLAPLSYQEYKRLFVTINQGIGHLKISKIKPDHLRAFYRQLSETTSKRTKEKLTQQTIKLHHRCINSVLQSATKDELISRNVARLVDTPKVPKKEAQHLDSEQAQLFVEYLANAEDIRTKCALSMLVFSGLRRGELCGLEWQDINFEKQTIHVVRNSQYVMGKGIISKAPKNDTSVRTVKMPPYVFQIISEYRKWYLQQRLMYGDMWQNSNRLFVAQNGSPIQPRLINDWLKVFLKQHTDLPKITPHSLRHTFCTLLIADGVDIRTVSAKAGHSQTSTTLNIYTHALKQADEIASSTLDNILTPKSYHAG